MKKFLLVMFSFIAVLYIIIFGIDFFFDFALINIVFIVGLIACFFTYGGRTSAITEGFTSISTFGNYVPDSKVNEFVSSLDPFFVGSVVTVVSAFIFI